MDKPVIAARTPICQNVEPGTYWWCACGESKTQPFCDGAHHGTGFSPVEVTVTEKKDVAWCCCKHTGSQPFCDGTHNRV